MRSSSSCILTFATLLAVVLGATAPAGDRLAGKEKKEPEQNLVIPLDLGKFMGAEAKGNRFCIIADASNSMHGAPIAQVKADILKTLSELKPTSKFYVIFFNATDIPMPHPTWLPATSENIGKVKPWIDDMGLKLKTLPQSSFERAFKLDPKPDAIFFLTDGHLQGRPDPIAQLKTLNAAEPKTTIHTIMFTRSKTKAAALTQLRTIAEQNGGTFRRQVTQK